MQNFRLSLGEPRSLRHRVAEVLREAILAGNLAPGERLVEADVAEQMNISRGTVREAIRMLEQEGLVVSHPHRETVITHISPEEVKEWLLPARLAVEQYAVKKALPKLAEEDYAHLQKLVDDMRIAGMHNQVSNVADLDMSFHQYLIQRSEQYHCAQIWPSIMVRIRAHFHRYAPNHPSLTNVADEHQELLDTLRGGNLEEVLALLKKHIMVF